MRLFTGLNYYDEMYKLEIYCCALNAGDVDELIPMLEEKGFIMTAVDSDSLRGEIVKEQYRDIVVIRKQLSSEGFSWSENAKRIKLPVGE
ncbi:hypothetical protein ES705_17361 [subsurface metagenome]